MKSCNEKPKVEMDKPKKDKEREERIDMEVIVDAYTEEEQAMGWYYYLEGKISFPIIATCIKERATSPLNLGDKVEIIEMADEEDCMHEMFVKIRSKGKRALAVPLAQLKPVSADEDSVEAVEDWHYWIGQGHVL